MAPPFRGNGAVHVIVLDPVYATEKCLRELRDFMANRVGAYRVSNVCGTQINVRTWIKPLIDIVIAPPSYRHMVGGVRVHAKARLQNRGGGGGGGEH